MSLWWEQVTALIKLKECEDTHLGEEVDRNWNEVVTQQYLFDRLAHEVMIFRPIQPCCEGSQFYRSLKCKHTSIVLPGILVEVWPIAHSLIQILSFQSQFSSLGGCQWGAKVYLLPPVSEKYYVWIKKRVTAIESWT